MNLLLLDPAPRLASRVSRLSRLFLASLSRVSFSASLSRVSPIFRVSFFASLCLCLTLGDLPLHAAATSFSSARLLARLLPMNLLLLSLPHVSRLCLASLSRVSVSRLLIQSFASVSRVSLSTSFRVSFSRLFLASLSRVFLASVLRVSTIFLFALRSSLFALRSSSAAS